jgi:hypothetical protein
MNFIAVSGASCRGYRARRLSNRREENVIFDRRTEPSPGIRADTRANLIEFIASPYDSPPEQKERKKERKKETREARELA